MKKIPAFFVILLLASYACKDSVYEPYNNNFFDFFPNSDGNFYYYKIYVCDTTGTIIQADTCKSYYDSDTIINSRPFQVKVDSIQIAGFQTINNSYFSKDAYGVFNFVDFDTNGFYILLPDSLRYNVSFPIQYPILTNSLEVNQTWHLFDAWADVPQFQVFSVDAQIIALHSFIIPNQSSTRFTEAYEIKYSANLTTGLDQSPELFEVNAWFAKGIGPVKWEGDSELINFFAGTEIYPRNTIVVEELISFKVN